MNVPPRKVVHLITSSFYGGPEKQIVQHLKRLDRARFKGILVSFLDEPTSGEILEKAAALGLENHGIPSAGPFDLGALRRLLDLVRREGVDLLCTHGYKSTVMGWWAGRREGVPVIAFSRGYTTENRKVAFYEWLERRFLERIHGVVFVAEGQARRLSRMGVKIRRSWVVHNAVDAEEYRSGDREELRRQVNAGLGLPPDARLVVAAGRFSPEKGHRVLVEAIAELKGAPPEPFFIFCGEGPCRPELERLAGKLGVMERCRFPGFIKDLSGLFRVMDFLVLPSFTEGLPNVVIEAFASSRPAVATRVGGVPEVVEDGVNGLLVPPGRPRELAEAMARLLEDPGRTGAMGLSGLRTVVDRFNFEEQNSKLEGIYTEVLDG